MSFSFQKIPFDFVPLAKRDQAFLRSDPSLKPFIPFEDSIEGLRKKIIDRNRFPFYRKELVRTIQQQYDDIPQSAHLSEIIDSLTASNTYTVTTAHQPSLFTGPLYFIYKAASCIHLAQQLKNEMPENNFVPVFILGAEDHDFEEINHLHLYGKTLEWNRPSGGSTGMMSIDGLLEVIEQIEDLLPQTTFATEIISILKASFAQAENYGTAAQKMVHLLFGKYGMLVLQMNSQTLKRIAIPIFRKEIIERPSYDLVNQTIQELKEIGFKPQAKPRELNLFYLTHDSRKRIVFEDGFYRVVDTDIRWSATNIIQKLEDAPQLFSPNVLTRPLYQELVLPNIAYVGGGGELAYWQERSRQFEAFDISYPVLIRRNSVMWVGAYMQKQLDKISLAPKDLFLETKAILLQLETAEIDLSLGGELEQLDHLYEGIVKKSDVINADLKSRILAEKAKQIKVIRQLEGKLTKAYKTKNEQKIAKIERIKSKLFPQGGLQERHDNFLPIYADYGPHFIDFLVDNLNPLEKSFLVIKAPKPK